MKIKGRYVRKQVIKGKTKEVNVKVELKQINGHHVPYQNIYYGVATVNGKDYKHEDLPYCVNAEYMAEIIGLEVLESWGMKIKKHKKRK